MSQTDPNKPSSRRLGRAGATVVGIVLAMIVVFFVGRLVWHDEVQETDPASVQAPDNTATGTGTPGG